MGKSLNWIQRSQKKLMTEVEESIMKSAENIEKFKFREALADAMNVARIGNKYLAEEEPWKLVKTDVEKTKHIIHTALIIAHKAAYALAPFLPNSSMKICTILNTDLKQKDPDIKPGHTLNEANILFKKIEDEEMDAQIDKLKTNQMEKESPVAEGKANITFDDFQNMDIRTGKIISAEKIEKADKLLKLSVDLGNETRTIVSGIAEHYTPEELLGKVVSVIANLAPKRLKGVESQGMILMAEDKEGNLAFVSPEKNMGPGLEIR